MIEGLAVASGESLGNSADIGETTMSDLEKTLRRVFAKMVFLASETTDHEDAIEYQALAEDLWRQIVAIDCARPLASPALAGVVGSDATCESCGGSGVIWPASPTCQPRIPGGCVIVERCGSCDKYRDDLSAAEALFGLAVEIECAPGRCAHTYASLETLRALKTT